MRSAHKHTCSNVGGEPCLNHHCKQKNGVSQDKAALNEEAEVEEHSTRGHEGRGLREAKGARGLEDKRHQERPGERGRRAQ